MGSYGTITVLKNGYTTTDPRLDRVPSSTTEHLEKYPLSALTTSKKPKLSLTTSMLIGVNWYENFDTPIPRRIAGADRYTIGEGAFGRLRGGHAVCGRNWKSKDNDGWWRYYNQGREGRCVEFAGLRVLTQSNRKRYDITSRFHYHIAQHMDEWRGCYLGHEGPAYEGTSGRAGLEVLRTYGAVVSQPKGAPMTEPQGAKAVQASEGIAAYRWALTWAEVRAALNVPDHLPGIPINNSWGINYPKEVILLDSAGERLLREFGEFGIVTDK